MHNLYIIYVRSYLFGFCFFHEYVWNIQLVKAICWLGNVSVGTSPMSITEVLSLSFSSIPSKLFTLSNEGFHFPSSWLITCDVTSIQLTYFCCFGFLKIGCSNTLLCPWTHCNPPVSATYVLRLQVLTTGISDFALVISSE